MVDRFAKLINVDRSDLPEESTFFSAIKRLKYTNGNSIYEKLLNLIVFRFYTSSQEIRHFFHLENFSEYIKIVD